MSQVHQEEHDGLVVRIQFQNEGDLIVPWLHAPTGDVFGLHDPETWQYFCFERKQAEFIAQGFPEYWTKRPDELLHDDTPDETASRFRNCGRFFTLDEFPPLTGLKNPFEILDHQLRQQGTKEVSLLAWWHCCGSLFQQFLSSGNARRPDIFFFSPSKDWTMQQEPLDSHNFSFAYRAQFDVYAAFDYCTRIADYRVRLRNREGDIYRLYQPETWQYVSLSRQTAEDICGGFPEYWDHRPDDELEASDAAATESLAHRRRVISRLAQQPIPLPDGFRLRKAHLMNLPEATRDELAALRTSNPFLLIERQLHHSRNPKSPDTEIWRYWATKLFEHLLTCKNVVKQPLFVGVPESDIQPCDEEQPTESAPAVANRTEMPVAPTPQVESPPPIPEDVTHQRGPTLISQQTLESMYRRSDDRPVQWGPLFYDESAAYDSHFCVAGAPRSGKTTLLRLLFQSLYTNVTPPPRFVFYDAKANLLPHMFPPGSLVGERLDDQVGEALFILSPHDERGTAWDIAKDVTNQIAAREIAEILFPKPEPGKKEFFSSAVWDVAVEIMAALTRKAGTQWTFFDFLCSMQLENVEAIMSSNPGGAQRYKAYSQGTGASAGDLIKTLRTETAPYLPWAAAWRFAKQRLSLREWAKSQTKSIVLFHVKKYASSCKDTNRILLDILAQELLANEDPKTRTFLYLDEFEHLERIGRMVDLAHDGVSQQVNMALAFHDLGTLQEVYRGATEGILGDAMFRAFFRVNTRSTSDWASDQIGSPEVKVKYKSTQRGTTKHEATREADPDQESSQTGEVDSEQYAIRRLVLPDEIRNLPMPKDTHLVSGYFMGPQHGPYRGTLPFSKLLRPAQEYFAAESTEENFYALWPKVEGVSTRCPQPDERYFVPDDTFFTLYQLGFRKPGYTPPATPPLATPEPTHQPPVPPPPDEQDSNPQSPPPDEQSPSNASEPPPPDEEKRPRPDPPKPERDYDRDIDLHLPDE